jgi:hypothetical protein
MQLFPIARQQSKRRNLAQKETNSVHNALHREQKETTKRDGK